LSWEEVVGNEQEQIIEEIAEEITQKNPGIFGNSSMTPEEYRAIEQLVRTAVASHPKVSPVEVSEIVTVIMGQASGYGPLQPFFVGKNSLEVTEVMVNPSTAGPRAFYGRKGKLHPIPKTLFRSNKEVTEFVQKICEDTGRFFGEDRPIVDAWLRDGSRLAAMGFKAAPLGTAFTIRKSPLVRPPMPLHVLVENGMFPAFVARLMVEAVIKGHSNFGVFGRTDSGKTTVLRAMGNLFDPGERVIVGETSFELSFPHLPNLINLVEVGYADKKIITMTVICEAILRNNPDRAVVGEIRGGEVVAASEIAESTSGGFCTTGHAGSIRDFCTRLPKMFERGGMKLPLEHVNNQVRSMFDFLFFFDKAFDGKRTLLTVVEVTDDPVNPFNTIIRFDEDEFASTNGKVRRWIYENPVTQKRLSRLAFRGAKNIAKFSEIKEKYITCDPDETEQIKKAYGRQSQQEKVVDDFLNELLGGS